MAALKVTAFGEAMGLVIPKDMLSRMRVEEGDTLFALETPDGYLLSAQDPEVARQVEFGLEGMREYDETFKRLAK